MTGPQGPQGPPDQATLGARVFRTTALFVPGFVATAIPFDDELFDIGGFHDPNSTQLFVPVGGAGLYQITGNAGIAGAVAAKFLQIRLNGTTTIASTEDQSVEDFENHLNVTTLYELAEGDFVELVVVATGDVAVAASPDFSPHFMLVRVG